MNTVYAELEYWDERTGGEMLMAALKASAAYVVADSVHVFNRGALSESGAKWGECSLWFSVALQDGATSTDLYYACRAARIRLKETSPCSVEVARMDEEAFFSWYNAEMQRRLADWEWEEALQQALQKDYEERFGEQ